MLPGMNGYLRRLRAAAPADLPVLDAVLRHWFAGVVAISMLMYAVSSRHLGGDSDWAFFTWGSNTLFGAHSDFVRGAEFIPADGRGGLHLYGSYPFLQIGPPTFAVGKLLQIGPRQGIYLGSAVIQALGAATVWLLTQTVPQPDRRAKATALLGGGAVAVVWVGLTHTGHLDDAMALTALAGAALAVTRSRPALAGLLLGLGASCKPWAVTVVALVLAFSGWRARLTAAGSAVAVILLCWAPFVIADPRTLKLGQVHLMVSPASAAAALGATRITDPQALRLVQFLGGLALATLVVGLGRWALAPLSAFAVRLLLEPIPYEYYVASLAVAALLADLRGWRVRLPLATLCITALWAAVTVLSTPAGALLRAEVFAAAALIPVSAAALARRRRPTQARLPETS
jgi:hypothetical protein